MINEATWEFIRQHRTDDVRLLALTCSTRLTQKKHAPHAKEAHDPRKGSAFQEVNLPLALQQISGWQSARQKLPTWVETDDIVYPPHLNMEQCSSELTARYKASLSSPTIHSSSSTFIDLTGGFGVDFYWMSQPFKHRVYVEQNADLCAVVRHNFNVLRHDCSVVCGNAADILIQTERADVVYLDPARRDEYGSRTYALHDCTPNVLELLPLLCRKTEHIILKLSPMLDWHKAISDLEQTDDAVTYVSEVHIVSVQNECKELLLVLEIKEQEAKDRKLCCVNLLTDVKTQRFETTLSAFRSALPPCSAKKLHPSALHLSPFNLHLPLSTPYYLYEPNASIMKAGCFDEIGLFYGLSQISASSHLFTGTDEIDDFPGRSFRVESITTMNKHDLKNALNGLKRANITVRNFPMSVDALRKKLQLKEGGDAFIFATTDADNRHLLLICRKIG